MHFKFKTAICQTVWAWKAKTQTPFPMSHVAPCGPTRMKTSLYYALGVLLGP